MKILLTGSDGFVGKQLAQALEAKGHKVVGFDIVSGQDILDYDAVHKAVKDVDIVYHVAAQADLTKITDLEKAREANDINVVGTYNMAHAAATEKKWLIYASTCCVYGNSHNPYGVDDEDATVPTPREMYAYTKLAGESIIAGYGMSFGLPYTILRYGTIYGPGMRGALAVHVFFDQAQHQQDITVHGSGKQERTYIYISDLIDACVTTIERRDHVLNQIINICGREKISVNKMAEDIVALTKSSSKIVHVADRPWQTFYENVNLEKARRLLGWEPETSWEEGLKKTADWYKRAYQE